MSTPPEYGPPLTLPGAKIAMAAAEAHALANGWPMVIAIVDSGGNLVMLTRMENAQLGSLEVAPGKALTAVKFRRATKAFQDLVGQGGAHLRMLAMPGVLPLEGGACVFRDGKIIGAIGVSGMSSAQDAEVAEAGIKAIGMLS